MPKKRVKKSAIGVFLLLLIITSTAVAGLTEPSVKPIVNQWGVTAPFLISWLPIWVFAVIGGIGSIFVKVDNIDAHFRWLYVAKPFLGVMGGVCLCLMITDGRDPPEVALTAYAAASSFFSSAILQFSLVLLSSRKNALAAVNKISPVQFELPDNAEDKS